MNEPFKNLAAAVMESMLRCYREPCILYKRISKKEFVKWLLSDECHFYETLIGWQDNHYYELLKRAGILNDDIPERTKSRKPIIYNNNNR